MGALFIISIAALIALLSTVIFTASYVRRTREKRHSAVDAVVMTVSQIENSEQTEMHRPQD